MLLLCACLIVLWRGDCSALPEAGKTSSSSQRNRRRHASGRGQAKTLGKSSASVEMDARSGRLPQTEVRVGRGPGRDRTAVRGAGRLRTNVGMMAPRGLEEENEEEENEGDSSALESFEDSCENYDTEEAMGDGWERGSSSYSSSSSSEERDQYDDAADLDGYDSQQSDPYSETADAGTEGGLEQEQRANDLADDSQADLEHQSRQGGATGEDNSVRVCVVTWNLAEESPPSRDVEFLKEAAKDSDLVAVGVQEIENLKPRRNEGGRTREWRRLLIR